MDALACTKHLVGVLAIGLSCSAFASPPLPENPGLIDALTPAALPAPEQLGLSTLEERLLESNSVSPSRKLALRAEIDDLRMRIAVAHRSGGSVEALRPRYERLMMKVRDAVKKDPVLFRDLMVSKDWIWAVLADPARFASLE